MNKSLICALIALAMVATSVNAAATLNKLPMNRFMQGNGWIFTVVVNINGNWFDFRVDASLGFDWIKSSTCPMSETACSIGGLPSLYMAGGSTTSKATAWQAAYTNGDNTPLGTAYGSTIVTDMWQLGSAASFSHQFGAGNDFEGAMFTTIDYRAR